MVHPKSATAARRASRSQSSNHAPAILSAPHGAKHSATTTGTAHDSLAPNVARSVASRANLSGGCNRVYDYCRRKSIKRHETTQDERCAHQGPTPCHVAPCVALRAFLNRCCKMDYTFCRQKSLRRQNAQRGRVPFATGGVPLRAISPVAKGTRPLHASTTATANHRKDLPMSPPRRHVAWPVATCAALKRVRKKLTTSVAKNR